MEKLIVFVMVVIMVLVKWEKITNLVELGESRQRTEGVEENVEGKKTLNLFCQVTQLPQGLGLRRGCPTSGHIVNYNIEEFVCIGGILEDGSKMGTSSHVMF